MLDKKYLKQVILILIWFFRQNKLNLMAKFMPIKCENPKLKQSEIAGQLVHWSSTLQRYKNDINMLSLYRIQPYTTNKRPKNVSNTTLDNNSHRKHDLKRPQMTSNDLKTNSNDSIKPKKNWKLVRILKLTKTI